MAGPVGEEVTAHPDVDGADVAGDDNVVGEEGLEGGDEVERVDEGVGR